MATSFSQWGAIRAPNKDTGRQAVRVYFDRFSIRPTALIGFKHLGKEVLMPAERRG
jgi:hypothetical protein